MFVTIKRLTGKSTIKVSMNQYEKTYKKKGYVIVEEERTKVVEETKESEEVEETNEVDVDSIPISDMSKEQLMLYAKKHNINTKGAKNVTEARKMIQKAVRDSKM